MSQVAERHETLTATFDSFRRDRAFGPPWLAALRQSAFDRFLDRGFPSTREEDWRFTSVAPIAETRFVRAVATTPAAETLAPFAFDGLPAIVVVNGRISKSLSNLG